MNVAEVKSQHILSISGGSHSRSTIAIYQAAYKSLGLDDQTIETVTVAQLRSWQAEKFKAVEAGKLSVQTLHRYTSVIKIFFDWCVGEEMISVSPATRLSLPKLPKNELPANIADRDLMRLLDAAYKSGPRNYAILRFLANTGCRVSGLTELKLDDLDLINLRANVCEKGGKSRYVYFNEATANAIRAWLVMRPTHYDDHVFIGLKGPLTRFGIRSLLVRLAAKAHVEGRYNPHSFRHAWARRALEQCRFDLGAVSHFLGHSRVQVTDEFYGRWTEGEWAERIHERDTLEVLERVAV